MELFLLVLGRVTPLPCLLLHCARKDGCWSGRPGNWLHKKAPPGKKVLNVFILRGQRVLSLISPGLSAGCLRNHNLLNYYVCLLDIKSILNFLRFRLLITSETTSSSLLNLVLCFNTKYFIEAGDKFNT